MVSQNLANVAVTGYRAEVPVDTFSLLLTESGPEPGTTMASVHAARQGALSRTGRSLDLALEGPGFFQVATEQGMRYTRRGDFRLDGAGRLVTSGGHPVMGLSGELFLNQDNIRIDDSGAIHGDAGVLDRLAVMQFREDTPALTYQSDGLYLADADSEVVSASYAVRQGFLEAANVDPMTEITRAMEVTRHFGASAQALRAYDQMLGAAISELGPA